MSVGSNTNGGYLLPTHLDPTLILTNSGSSNVIRGLSRVVTLNNGETTWHGVTTAGVTASWDGELAEVSDDTPTLGSVSIATNVAQAFVQGSIAAFQDIANLTSDVMMLFADARDRLEGAAHATGLGFVEPAEGHLHRGERLLGRSGHLDHRGDHRRGRHPRAVPGRPGALAQERRLADQPALQPRCEAARHGLVSSSYSGDLTQAVADKWLNKPVVESDDAPTTQTTTALDNEILFGDFSNYVIVDKPGGMSVEYIPHLFNTANNLPDGRRGYFAYWRTGADAANLAAFRMLVDKTSA
jgi:hypothetical protein